jgi:retron-type reverse transcriptase
MEGGSTPLMLKDAGCSDGLQRLEAIRKLNAKSEWVNSDLYRLLFKPELYILAYERIKSKPGNMTPGTDEETVDGFGMGEIQALISSMRTQRYQPKPVRTAHIPKSNGKMRKLGIPSTRDKVVQEVIRLILEAFCCVACKDGMHFQDFRMGRPVPSARVRW